jgi:transcriptional regulator with XRE-family HTH domain
MLKLKADRLLKHNIDALLKARGQTRHDLAFYCRRSDAWLSKIMDAEEDRNIQLEYLDRIADFFGIATYQLFQPGISPLTERRSGLDRRAGRDRRISAAVPTSQRPGDVDLMDLIRALTREGRERAIQIVGEILNDEIQHLRTRPASPAGANRTAGNAESVHAPSREKTGKDDATTRTARRRRTSS